jgi:hypothetical protein
MNDEEFSQILARGHEQRGIEFKGPCARTDNQKFATIARAIMGMANRRDGGIVIIGIDDTGGELLEQGLVLGDLATWRYDEVSTALANYVDPNIEFELENLEYKARSYVIISVKEFAEIPVICKKDFNYIDERSNSHVTVTRNGGCYVRTRTKPETTEVPTQTEMRELLELAVDKGIRRFIERTYSVGLDLSTSVTQSNQAQFNQHIDAFFQENDLIDKIKSRGYWNVEIKPVRYDAQCLPDISSLLPIIEKSSVQLRGWDFPHIDTQRPTRIDIDWIEQSIDWQHIISTWRFHQSGQFIFIGGNFNDWRDQSGFWPADEDWQPNVYLDIEDAIFTFAEIFEFTARLSMTSDCYEKVNIKIDIGNIANRFLHLGRGTFPKYRGQIEHFPFEIEVEREELLACTKKITLQASRELFLRFGYDISIDRLREWQNQLLKRGH